MDLVLWLQTSSGIEFVHALTLLMVAIASYVGGIAHGRLYTR